MAVAATTSTTGNAGGWVSKVGVAAVPLLSFAISLGWVADRVSGQLLGQSQQADNMHTRLRHDLEIERKLQARLQEIIQHDRALEAERSSTVGQLTVEHQEVVAEEKAINRTIIQIDQLTHQPPTNLLPITSSANLSTNGTIAMPSLPQAPPVHATTGASGIP